MKKYHFCAMSQRTDTTNLEYFDGIIQTGADLGEKDQYDALKDELAKSLDGAKTGRDVIMLSLTSIS